MGIESLKQVENILNNTSEIICFFSEDGKVCFINEAGKETLGYKGDAVSIRDILPGVFPTDKNSFDIAKEKQDKSLMDYVYRANHTCFSVNVRISFTEELKDDNLCAVYMLDLSDLERQEKQNRALEDNMKEALRARDEFTANLTHELRTPVNGIKGHVRNLKDSETDFSKKRKMDIVLQCCENMETIINNLLDFSKLENGKMVLEEEEFSLNKLVETSVSALESVANEKGLKLTSHVADNVPDLIIGDEFRLSQIINNLLNNAIKFTASGHVRLEVFKTNQKKHDVELTFFVIDTGIGMSESDKDKLFKSFTQVDGSITRQFGGTGLGLYVCKQIVELMGGSIRVESEAGKGSTFIFSIQVKTEIEMDDEAAITIADLMQSLLLESDIQGIEEHIDFFDKANIEKLNDYIEKTILCVELENWTKAENFASVIKRLVEGAPSEISSIAFRLVMNARKEKQDECRKYLEELKELVEKSEEAGE